IPGSARGFLITACNKAPAIARFIPTTIDMIALGILDLKIIALAALLPLPRIVSQTSFNSNFTLPKPTDTTAIKIRSKMLIIKVSILVM
ncbi:MAG: hypothetical protein MI748_18730, partial [Opitutales bacterium]|nr:hypothetical protein [Opitutales bacterium]